MPATYRTPRNLVELLDGAVRSAARTTFYSPGLAQLDGIRALSDLTAVPVTALSTYRRQRLPDVLSDASKVDWIAGPYRGQSASAVAVAEGADETEVRYELLTDAVTARLGSRTGHTAAVVTSGRRQHFGAEVATVLTGAGVPAHLFPESSRSRARGFLSETAPEVVVALSNSLREEDLPRSVELCVTFRRSHRMERVPQLDLYLVDELGLIAQSDDCDAYAPNRDVFYLERSDDRYLVVTSLYNRVRPMVRIMTEDSVEFKEDGSIRITNAGGPSGPSPSKARAR